MQIKAEKKSIKMEPDEGPGPLMMLQTMRVSWGFYFEGFVPLRLYTLLSLPLWLLLCFSPASDSVRVISSLCAGSHLVGLQLSLSSRPSSSSSSLVFYFNLCVFFLYLSLPILLSVLLYRTYFLCILSLCRRTCEPLCLLIKLPNRSHLHGRK